MSSDDDAKRDRSALELRKAGASVDRIADALDFADVDEASAAIQRALHDAPAIDDAHRLELERLDAMQRALWPAALKGNRPAVESCLSIMERRARLLGLDGKRDEKPEGDRIDQIAEQRKKRRAVVAAPARKSRS